MSAYGRRSRLARQRACDERLTDRRPSLHSPMIISALRGHPRPPESQAGAAHSAESADFRRAASTSVFALSNRRNPGRRVRRGLRQGAAFEPVFELQRRSRFDQYSFASFRSFIVRTQKAGLESRLAAEISDTPRGWKIIVGAPATGVTD